MESTADRLLEIKGQIAFIERELAKKTSLELVIDFKSGYAHEPFKRVELSDKAKDHSEGAVNVKHAREIYKSLLYALREAEQQYIKFAKEELEDLEHALSDIMPENI